MLAAFISSHFHHDSSGHGVDWKHLKGSRGAPMVQRSRAREVPDFAHGTPQDMVVITSQGRSGFTRWWLGSAAETLVRASGDPVLIIPSRQSAGDE